MDINLPKGWVNVTTLIPDARLDRDDALGYFDGKQPTWKIAAAPEIGRRPVVAKLVLKLSASRARGEVRVTVVKGPGSEGKSTALRQTACDLSREQGWQVIWRERRADPLTPNHLLDLPREEGVTWLFVSDDDQIIADSVFEGIRELHENDRKGVQFLLACQDVDWKSKGANTLEWDEYAAFEYVPLRGFDGERDAEVLVRTWGRYGTQGLGRLARFGANLEAAAGELVQAARTKEAEFENEGAVLGAMLDVRIGQAALRARVQGIVNRLKVTRPPDRSFDLSKPFTYAAVMHDAGLTFLTKAVLAKALGYDQDDPDFEEDVVFPLEEETVVSAGGDRILTRNILIARVAAEILTQGSRNPRERVSKLRPHFEQLMRAAHALYARRTNDGRDEWEEYNDWKYLPDSIYKIGRRDGQTDLGKAQQDAGVALAKVMHDLTPNDPRLINQLARMLRETGELEESRKLFREAPPQARWHRSLYREWAQSERAVDDNCEVETWLYAVELSDMGGLEKLTVRWAKFGLASLAESFHQLDRRRPNHEVFKNACWAAADLGLTQLPTLRTGTPGEEALANAVEETLLDYRSSAARDGALEVGGWDALENVKAGVVLAWAQRQGDLPQWVPAADRLVFGGLARVLEVSAPRAGRDSSTPTTRRLSRKPQPDVGGHTVGGNETEVKGEPEGKADAPESPLLEVDFDGQTRH